MPDDETIRYVRWLIDALADEMEVKLPYEFGPVEQPDAGPLPQLASDHAQSVLH